MVQSIGVDIVDIARMTAIVHRWGDKFTRKILTPEEYRYCIPKAGAMACIAARFAVKEALFKALPPDLQDSVGWRDIEVLNDISGRPQIHCLGRLKKLPNSFDIHVSISHSRECAIAMIVLAQKGAVL